MNSNNPIVAPEETRRFRCKSCKPPLRVLSESPRVAWIESNSFQNSRSTCWSETFRLSR